MTNIDASNQNKIKLFLLTGFLGSGKTTFVRYLIDQYSSQGKKIAVVVNEFGKVSVDGPVLEQAAVQIEELNNGSIFCKCLEGRFVEALETISRKKPDIVLVESTGLADPTGMQDIMFQVNRKTDKAYAYSGVICLIDARNYLRISKSLLTVGRQILAATLIIINKKDLAEQAQLQEVRAKIRQLNPLVTLVEAEYGQINLDELDNVRRSRLNRHLKTLITKETRPDLFLISSQSPITNEALQAFVNHFQDDCHRIKGFVQTTDGLLHVDWVADSGEIKPSMLIRDKTEIVLIPKDASAMPADWRKLADKLLAVNLTIGED